MLVPSINAYDANVTKIVDPAYLPHNKLDCREEEAEKEEDATKDKESIDKAENDEQKKDIKEKVWS